MRNVKTELERIVADRTPIYGYIFVAHATPLLEFNSISEYLDILTKLDNVSYDETFGSQWLYGTVVFNDGTWITRDEYDGAECWQDHRIPSREGVRNQAKLEWDFYNN